MNNNQRGGKPIFYIGTEDKFEASWVQCGRHERFWQEYPHWLLAVRNRPNDNGKRGKRRGERFPKYD